MRFGTPLLALAAFTWVACGARTGATDPFDAETRHAVLSNALCRKILESPCGSRRAMSDCVLGFEILRIDAEDRGCVAEDSALMECHYREGFSCNRGVLLTWNGCSSESDDLARCLGSD